MVRTEIGGERILSEGDAMDEPGENGFGRDEGESMSLPSKLSASNNGSDGGSTSSLYVARDEGLDVSKSRSSEDIDEEAVIILELDGFVGIASC